ncbi:hypothetical protein ACOSP7_027615 [Xanthoceras sorbifolium]|uniref:UBA domain-containing protein n=1 Tax=Xanthoceras sorbifolium TaxID=99658 RepID=A0ABQ8HGK8_9ROSI|nr:hypothetical protein JRO89_XS11G0212600 [Xanthoceras sorbifolium]
MDYDYRNRTSSPYGTQIPMYGPPATSSAAASHHPMYGTQSTLYPRIGQPAHTAIPTVGRSSSHHHQSSSPSSSSSSGLGIRVALKPEYRITHPPPLTPQVGDIPRSNFQFDFEFERKVLAEAEKEKPNWSGLGSEDLPSKTTGSTSSLDSVAPVVRKYIASGLNREAVPIAVARYGDNPTKVQEFANGFSSLREMGFSSSNVSEALFMYDNDTEKALAHCLGSAS